MSERIRRLVPLLLLVAAVCPYFIGLGDSAIWDANEAFYVETPREMMERGDYISPTFNYEPRLNKPVLSYWIVAGFYKAFGTSVAVQRVPIALGAIVLIAIAFLLARFAAPAGSEAGVRPLDAALWAALGLAIAPRLLMFARRIFIDVYISMFMALALVCFAAAERYPARRRLWLVLMYVAVGLGVLTKGPVAALVPGLVFAVYLLVYGELKRAREMMIPAGVLIVLAIVIPWYAALYQRDGWTYIVSFFVGENVDRYTTGYGVRVERGLWFYLPVVFSDSFPWSMYLLPAAAWWWQDRRRAIAEDPAARTRTLLWLWILVITGFFSLSAAKQDLYIFPIVPAIAALAGCAIARALPREPSPGAWTLNVTRTTALVGVLLAAAGVVLLYLFRTAGATYAIDGVAVVGIIGLAGGVVAAMLSGRSLFAAVTVIAASVILLNYTFVMRTLPSFEAYKPVPAFAAALDGRAGPEDVVATYDQALPSMVFYLRRHIVEVFEPEPLFELLASARGAYVVMSSDDYEKLRSRMPVNVCIVDRRQTFDVKLKNVLARERLPELVVVSNRCQ